MCHRAFQNPDLTSGWVACTKAWAGLLKASRSMHSLRAKAGDSALADGACPWLMAPNDAERCGWPVTMREPGRFMEVLRDMVTAVIDLGLTVEFTNHESLH